MSTQSPTSRGGAFHAYLIDQIRRLAENQGYAVELEAEFTLPDGRRNYVDLLFRHDNLQLAVEVETTDRNAVANIRKAIQAGLTLRVLAATPALRRRIQTLISRQIGSTPTDIRVYSLLQLQKELIELKK